MIGQKLLYRLSAIGLAAVLTSGAVGSIVPVYGAEQIQSTEGMPGEPPSGTPGDQAGGTPPEMPEGGMEGGPGGDMQNTPPDKPDGEMGEGGPEGGMGGPGGMSAEDIEYDSIIKYNEDASETDLTVESTGKDENAILVDGSATVDITGLTVSRKNDGSTGGDNSSFYGVGAAVFNKAGTLYLNGGTINTDSKGGAGVFSYGDGITYVKDVTIDTEQSTSGGIHAAGGGKLYAWNVTAETDGESSAAIRSDRGGGTMVIDGGTYTSNGSGSPALYCTADITVKDAVLTATGSEGLCLEGLNTVRLFDTDLTSNMPDNEQNDNTWSVILYQSMSGDSEVGEGSYQMVGGSLTSTNGGLFYSTNTESRFYLSDVTINAEDPDYFLKVTGNSNARGWGTSGQNGAKTIFTADAQDMAGDVIWDSISTLDLYMVNGSVLTGAVMDDESNAGDGGDGYAVLYIDDTSRWVVTGDSTLTDLYADKASITDADGKTVTIKGIDGTVYVEGESGYTITVNDYHTEADMSGADSAPSWEDYKMEEPELFLINSETTENASIAEIADKILPAEAAEAVTEAVTEAVSEAAEENGYTDVEVDKTTRNIVYVVMVASALSFLAAMAGLGYFIAKSIRRKK